MGRRPQLSYSLFPAPISFLFKFLRSLLRTEKGYLFSYQELFLRQSRVGTSLLLGLIALPIPALIDTEP
jgi:hypothetical protein